MRRLRTSEYGGHKGISLQICDHSASVQVKFGRGNDGGAYVVAKANSSTYDAFEIGDKILEVRCEQKPAVTCRLPEAGRSLLIPYVSPVVFTCPKRCLNLNKLNNIRDA